MARPPAPAPELPGYTLIRHIGGGGFADVFLYRQESLDREVAIKVLLASDSSPAARARFENEGAVMARLSEEHRNIVPVYDAAICADGRPYLIMQYCPKPDLARRYKTGPFAVAEVLSDRRAARRARSSPRTGRASCTGTSSRPTCSPRGPAGRRSPTSASR